MKGNYYAEIAANPERDYSAAVRAFLTAIEKQLPGRTTLPDALSWFPREKLTSLRVAPESVMGMRVLKRGYAAQYEYDKAFLVREASAEAAGGVLQRVRARFTGTADAQVGDELALLRATDGDWAVSAAALFLLRTLSKPHTRSSPVGAQLIPHCGQLVCAPEGDEALVFYCNTGGDFEIRHVGNGFQLAAPDGRFFQLPSDEWRDRRSRVLRWRSGFLRRVLAQSAGRC